VGDRDTSDTTANAALRRVLKSQYHASLAMLRHTIEHCPTHAWEGTGHTNDFWQIAYHTLFFTHMYLQPEEAAFRPWPGHQGEVQHPDGIAGPADPRSALPLLPRPYTRTEVLAYWQACEGMVDEAVDALELGRPTSGFDWYRMSKLEHQLVNLRHVQHHTAQLADRLRSAADLGTPWVDAGSERP
jgi:hypothetical protein